MPVIKKIKYDLGEGEEIIKISLNTQGVFNADIPARVFQALHKNVKGHSTLSDCLTETYSVLKEYTTLNITEKWIILVGFKSEGIHQFFDNGISMELKYIPLKKVAFGKKVTCYLLSKSLPGGEWQSLRNEINIWAYSGFTELDFSEDLYNSIELLHNKLKDLSGKLTDLCKSKELILNLVNTTLMISSGKES